MDTPPALSPILIAAAALRGIWAAVFSRLGTKLDPHVVISDWVSGIFRRLEELLVQYQAGQYQAGQYQAGQTAAFVAAGCGGAWADASQPTGAARIRVAGAGTAKNGGMAGDISARALNPHSACEKVAQTPQPARQRRDVSVCDAPRGVISAAHRARGQTGRADSNGLLALLNRRDLNVPPCHRNR